jgi:hypothetical protein
MSTIQNSFKHPKNCEKSLKNALNYRKKEFSLNFKSKIKIIYAFFHLYQILLKKNK